MSTAGLVLSGVLVIVGILLSIIILLQSKRSAGLGSISGGGQDTYWSQNKGNSMEGALEKYTKIFGALFFTVALLVSFFA